MNGFHLFKSSQEVIIYFQIIALVGLHLPCHFPQISILVMKISIMATTLIQWLALKRIVTTFLNIPFEIIMFKLQWNCSKP